MSSKRIKSISPEYLNEIVSFLLNNITVYTNIASNETIKALKKYESGGYNVKYEAEKEIFNILKMINN